MAMSVNKRKATKAKRTFSPSLVKQSTFTEPRCLHEAGCICENPIATAPSFRLSTNAFEQTELTSRGRKRLINAAKHLVGTYLLEAGFTPLKEQTGYSLKTLSVRNYEEIKLVFGPTTQAEKDMHDALDLIADVMMGRPIINEIDFNADGFDGELGSLENAEIEEVIAKFNRDYRKVGGGKVRNIGLVTPDFDETARNEADRRNPLKFSLLKSTSGKRHHVVIFGKLYSFGKKKAATAS